MKKIKNKLHYFNNMEGWIKIHRRILDNPISRKPNYAWLWTVLLLKASHKEHSFIWNKKKVICREGQIYTGRKKLSEETGISSGSIENILNYLETEQQIEQQKTTKFRLITILKWKEYQQTEQQTEQQSDNRVTTDEQQNNTYKNDKNDKNENNTTNVVQPDKEFGNTDINFLLKEFENIMQFKSSSSKDRIFANHLIKNFSREQLRVMLEFCRDDDFIRVGSLEKLWFKRGDIIAGLQNQTNKANTVFVG